MLIHTLIVSSALMAAPQAPPPRATPETPRKTAPAQEPAAVHKDHAAPAADAAFVKKAAEGGMMEVELAKLAEQKAENSDVKAFAAKLVKDHTAANDELKTLAGQKNITLPPAKKSPLYAKLEAQSGAAFDRAYVTEMLADHQKDVKAFEKQASTGTDADIKAFASKTLPTLREHLQQVQDLAKAVGAKKPTS